LQRYNDGVPLATEKFKIRDFEAQDFETLWRMDQECFPPGISYSRRELGIYIRRRGALTLVAADDSNDSIAGFIVGYGGSTGHIITIDVAPAARRSGVGSLLLRGVEARLFRGGSRSVGLETAVDNVTALAFYKRHGYHVIGTSPRYYSNGVDALVLRKELGIGAPISLGSDKH
jgi:[ribosomal protein S18]-alanine N-acetyltransferase